MQAEILRGHSTELLKELHILTRDGKLNQDSQRKLKQIQHLYQFIQPILLELNKRGTEFAIADHGAGKSYLGFILYDLFLRSRDIGHVYGVESRPELSDRSRLLAQRLGFARMKFISTSVQHSMQAEGIPETVELVTALHACDTATDDAVEFGLKKCAKFMVLVPCCQAEVASALRRHKALSLSRSPLAELWRRPLHTREIGSQITNVLRCLYLEAQGYRVSVTELVGWEHSLKNELIMAQWTGQRRRSAAERLQAILSEFGLSEALSHRYHL